jgi:DNA mismatch endonuclease (patch repair protein)
MTIQVFDLGARLPGISHRRNNQTNINARCCRRNALSPCRMQYISNQDHLVSQLVDIVDKKTRSRMMAGIRSKNTKPEILTRAALHKKGYRFRLDSKVRVNGQSRKISPDIVLRKHNLVVFVHSCYFHQHSGCQLAYSDREYTEFWTRKFRNNVSRDKRQIDLLLNMGWRVAIVWECATRNKPELAITIQQLDDFIKSKKNAFYESSYKKGG